MNALGALGKKEALRNVVLQRDPGAREPPREGAGGRAGADPLASEYAQGAASRTRSARRTSRWRCGRTRPWSSTTSACVFGQLGRKPEALDALRKAWDAGFKDADWTRRDPDLAILHGDPEFEKLYPPARGVSTKESGR